MRGVDSNIQETDPQQTTRDTSTNGDGDGATDGATGSTEEPDDEELDRLYEISMKQVRGLALSALTVHPCACAVSVSVEHNPQAASHFPTDCKCFDCPPSLTR